MFVIQFIPSLTRCDIDCVYTSPIQVSATVIVSSEKSYSEEKQISLAVRIFRATVLRIEPTSCVLGLN